LLYLLKRNAIRYLIGYLKMKITTHMVWFGRINFETT
jgi:hypothetical protein